MRNLAIPETTRIVRRAVDFRSGLPAATHSVSAFMRVLLLEDNASYARLVTARLTTARGGPYEVVRVESLSDALAAAREGRFDVVLADLNLPDSRGVETASRILAAAPHVPLVVLTGLDDDEAALASVGLGAEDFISKEDASASVLSRALRYAVERRRLKEALRRREEQARREERIDALSRLAGGVAHDLNNILAAIIGFDELMLSALPEGDRLRSFADEIRKAADRASSLSSQLAAVGGRQVLRAEDVDLAEFVRVRSDRLRALAGEGIEVVLAIQEAGRVVIDPVHLERVLLALLARAKEAMPTGGRLVVSTARMFSSSGQGTEPAPREDAERFSVLTVADSGPGMDEKTRAHLFEPFSVARGAGAGLRLAMIYGTVKQSGGRILVESAPAEGTAFHVLLPRVSSVAIADRAGAPQASGVLAPGQPPQGRS